MEEADYLRAFRFERVPRSSPCSSPKTGFYVYIVLNARRDP